MKILIIEDSDYWQKRYRRELPSSFELIQATDLKTAEAEIQKLISGKTTFDAIVFDTCIAHPLFFDAEGLVRKVKKFGFTGHMIASSAPSTAHLSRELHKSGCTHAFSKYTLGYALSQLLPIKK